MPQMFRMAFTRFAAAMAEIILGLCQCGCGEDIIHQSIIGGAQRRRIRCDACCDHSLVHGICDEHFPDIGPQQVQRILHSAVAFIGPVAKADHRVCRALQMVGHLFARLFRDGGDLCIAAFHQGGQLRQVPCVKQELAHDRLTEIAVGLFDQQQIAEIPNVTVKGQPIRIATRVFNLACQIQPQRGLADQVQRGIRQRDVFF